MLLPPMKNWPRRTVKDLAPRPMVDPLPRPEMMRRRLGWIILWFVLAAGTEASATRVWIDTDPSIGAPYREVDDGFALVLAFHSPERKIAGLSTTYGNAKVTRATEVARDL